MIGHGWAAVPAIDALALLVYVAVVVAVVGVVLCGCGGCDWYTGSDCCLLAVVAALTVKMNTGSHLSNCAECPRRYKCSLTLSATRLTKITDTVALKEIHAMRDLVAAEAGEVRSGRG